MLKLNRKVEYGLVALKYMHSKPKGRLTTVREICEHHSTPFDPLAHVLRILNTEGILQSEQGAHGGYRIVANLEDISFAHLIEIIDGQLGFTDCIKFKDCSCTLMERCNIISPMFAVNQQLLQFLRSISLATLVQPDAIWSINGKEAIVALQTRSA